MNFGDLHPFFVHFPIAFFILILIIEIMRLFTSRIHSIVSLTILFLGTTLAFLAVQSGESEKARTLIYLDELSSNLYIPLYPGQDHLLLAQTSEITEEINDHEQKGNIVMWSSIIIFFIWLWMYLKKKDYKYIKILLILILVVFVLRSAFSGGKLVRDRGIGSPNPDYGIVFPPSYILK